MKRLKTLSKYYYNDEILAKEADGTIHLKEGVKRVAKWPQLKDAGMLFNLALEDREQSEHINEYRRNKDLADFAKQITEEEKNFND